MKVAPIKEDWQADIAGRDLVEAECLPSKIAKLLYPEIPHPNARLAKMRVEGGAFTARIEDAAREKARKCEAALREWEAKT